MVSAYVAHNPNSPVKGLVLVGLRNNGPDPLNGLINLKKVHLPVLDIWGADSKNDQQAAGH